MNEYKIARGWAVLISISCLFLAGIMLTFLGVLIAEHGREPLLWIFAPLCLGMAALSVFGMAEAIRTRCIIEQDKVVSRTALRCRELYFDEIKGYRNLAKYILIVPLDPQKKPLRISQQIQHKNELLQWLSHRFADIDVLEANEEQQAMLENEAFGASAEEREQHLKRARKVARIVNGAGIVSAAWFFFMGRPYDISLFVLMLFPVLALAVLARFRGLIRINPPQKSLYPNLTWSFLYPCLSLCLRAIIDFHIFRYNDVWLPCILIAAMLLAALLLVRRGDFNYRKAKDYISIASISLLLFAYSYGLVISLNCEYDASQPERYTARVLDKHVTKGKSTTYTLNLSPWGPQQKEDQVDVSSRFYDKVSVNDEVLIRYKKGRFRIPWFIIGNE